MPLTCIRAHHSHVFKGIVSPTNHHFCPRRFTLTLFTTSLSSEHKCVDMTSALKTPSLSSVCLHQPSLTVSSLFKAPSFTRAICLRFLTQRTPALSPHVSTLYLWLPSQLPNAWWLLSPKCLWVGSWRGSAGPPVAESHLSTRSKAAVGNWLRTAHIRYLTISEVRSLGGLR